MIGVHRPPNENVHSVANRVDRNPIGSRDIDISEDRSLLEVERQDRLAVGTDGARGLDVVELSRREEVLDGALQHAGAQRDTWRDARVAAKHLLRNALIATKDHAIGRCTRTFVRCNGVLLRPGWSERDDDQPGGQKQAAVSNHGPNIHRNTSARSARTWPKCFFMPRTSRPLGFRRTCQDLEAQLRPIWSDFDLDFVTASELAHEDLLGQRILDVLLDRPL